MAAVTICSDFEAPQNKVWHCFYCFPILEKYKLKPQWDTTLYLLVRLPIIKKMDSGMCWWNNCLIHWWWDWKIIQSFQKTIWWFLIKLNIHLAQHFRCFLKMSEMKSSQKTYNNRMIIAFLVIVMKCWGSGENIQQMSSTVTLKKCGMFNTMEYFSA